MSIRIAKRPPTEEGWYWHREQSSHIWRVVFVQLHLKGHLCYSSPWIYKAPLDVQHQFSTRIPDPEETEDE